MARICLQTYRNLSSKPGPFEDGKYGRVFCTNTAWGGEVVKVNTGVPVLERIFETETDGFPGLYEALDFLIGLGIDTICLPRHWREKALLYLQERGHGIQCKHSEMLTFPAPNS